MNLRNIASVLAAVGSKEEKSTRVIGGRESTEGRYSYAVSLADDLGSFCGASLIAPDIVLSAAHCAGGDYHVIIGRHDLDVDDGDEVEIKKEIVHPRYDTYTTDNDFMVLVLDRPTTAKVSMVQLNDDATVPKVGGECVVMGWGDTTQDDYTSEASSVLMEVTVNAISNAECSESEGEHGGYEDSYDGLITEHMLCARDKNEDSCQGDSGGPLVIRNGANHATGENDILVGVVSWGIGCASNVFPGVYARVSSQYSWIRKKVCKFSSDPPAYFRCLGNRGIRANENATDSGHNLLTDWDPIMLEDFKTGYGFFYEVPNATTHYKFLKNRVGVVRIKNLEGETFNSRKIVLDNNTYSLFRVTLDMYALEMNDEDEFCLDISRDSGVTWVTSSCIDEYDDFQVGVWYSPDIEFTAEPGENTLMIRFTNTGDVLLNMANVLGWNVFEIQS